MKKSILFFAVLIGLASCGSNSTTSNAQNQAYVTQSPQQQPQQVQVQGTPDLVGFDINQFNSLLRTTKDPDALTQALNSQPNSINNLDLNGDGNADYLIVNQIGSNLQVVDQVSSNPSDNVVVATLTVTNNNGSGSYQIVGSPQYSGANYQYQSPQGMSFGQLLFLSWWISPYHYSHPYHSRYVYGHYPSYYRPYHSPRPYNRAYISSHTTTTRTITKTGGSTVNTTKSPVRAQTPVQTPKPVQSISAPVKSQAAFKANAGTNYKAPTTNAFKPAQRAPQQTRQVSAPSRPPSRPTSTGGGRRR